MAEIAVDRDVVMERTGFRLSWGAIFAGFFVAIGVHLVLALLGIAIGMSGWSPGEPGGPGAGQIAAGVGIWAAISALIALFVGGATTGRLAGILTPQDGFLHGVVLWSLTTVATIWMITSGLGFLLGGAFDVAGQTASAAVQVAGEAAFEVAGPAISGAAQGNEREAMVTAIAERTGLSRSEAESIVADSETRARAQGEQVASTIQQRAPEIAEDVAGTTARGAWWTLLALGLSLGAASAGAAVTARD